MSAIRRRDSSWKAVLVRYARQSVVRGNWQRLGLLPDAGRQAGSGVQLQSAADLGQTCEPQGTRWHDGKLYLTRATAAFWFMTRNRNS